MLSQQISWLFDSIIPSLPPSLPLSLGDRGSSSNCCRCTGEQQWSSQREPQWSRTEAKQPTAPLATGDASNNLRGVGSWGVEFFSQS